MGAKRQQHADLQVLCEQVAGGVVVYGALVALFDIASLRTLLATRLRPAVTRFRLS